MSDEARREAERRWPAGSGVPGLTYPAEALREYRQAGFVAGAEWQSARDAERVAELEAEVERLRARYYNATAGSTSLRAGEQDKIEKAIAVKRAETAEATLHRIRDTLSNAPECDQYDDDDVTKCGWKRDMQAVIAILDGSDT